MAQFYDDGIGYVNNLGASKYWGVTKHPNKVGWCISFTPARQAFTKTFYFVGVKGTEEDAAQIAKELHKYKDIPFPTEPIRIVVNSGVEYVVDIFRNHITRGSIKIQSKECKSEKPVESLFEKKVDPSWGQDKIDVVKHLVELKLKNDTDDDFWDLIQDLVDL